MLARFQQHLAKNLPFLAQKRVLLAVSGGIDSMAMADLFLRAGFEIGIAHCNFGLRAAESDEDEQFVREFATSRNIPVFTSKFDTQKLASDFGLSIQVAARELRYKWFDELLSAHAYDFVATAHHQDDSLETFIINLSRGTGIGGLVGIPLQNGRIVRPMLAFSAAEIESYATAHGLSWREDSSNASDKYLRNRIRRHVVPALKQIDPKFLNGFVATQEFLAQTRSMAQDASAIVYQKVARPFGDEIRFDLGELKKLPNFEAYLFDWLSPFGFSAWSDIRDLVDAQPGKQVYSPTHVLLKDRGIFVLSARSVVSEPREYRIYKGMETLEFPLKIALKNVKKIGAASNSTIFVDAEKLRFPLVLRRWKEGDVFYPLGMDGNSKKVSKFFKDSKFSLREKENAWLLCSQDDVVWIVGHRADARFYANATTTNILHIAATE